MRIWFRIIGSLVLLAGPTLIYAQRFKDKLERAEALYILENPSSEEDMEAISLYREVLGAAPDSTISPLGYAMAAEHLGTLLLTYGKADSAAISYRGALRTAHSSQLPDSLTYSTHIYLGEALFGLGKLDSSLLHLQQAERLQGQLRAIQPERLYNALGVYFYETGNYVQSIAYFSKAESYLENPDDEYGKYAHYSFRSNKASALAHLGKYDSAQRIYLQLLDMGINGDQLRVNLSKALLEQGKPEEALKELRLVGKVYGQGSVPFLHLLAKTNSAMGDLTEARKTLLQADAVLGKRTRGRKSYQKGEQYHLLGGLALEAGNDLEALQYFHRAITELHPGFSSENPRDNPDGFELGMAMVSLFEVMVEKADVSWRLFVKNREKKWFDLGLETYQSAFDLSHYISANYDNDEARVFLGDMALQAYRKAITQLYVFFIESHDKTLIRRAFEWSEISKAGALRIGAGEERMKKEALLSPELLDEEKNLLFRISRNYQRQFAVDDAEQSESLSRELTDLQVSLSRTREKLRTSKGWEAVRQEWDFGKLTESMPENLGIFSFFLTEDKLFCFWVEHDFLDWRMVEKNGLPLEVLNAWTLDLKLALPGLRYQPPAETGEFYQSTLGEFEQRLSRMDQLIIIPHDVLSAVPFEALQDASGKYLIEKLPVSYSYSASLLQSPQPVSWNSQLFLAMAPFVAYQSVEYPDLKESLREVSGVDGKKLINEKATKRAFLESAGDYRFVHLATHAQASGELGSNSFIVFYPEEEEFKLFSHELAYQDLEGVDLIYLSACETGSGELSSSEGLISLARSLSFAGCGNLVTSLWVSEDLVSAYLARRFYHHLDFGNSYAQALRAAKMDLLNDPSMSQYHHPAYWSNYILIAQRPADDRESSLILWVMTALALVGMGLALRHYLHQGNDRFSPEKVPHDFD